MQVSIVNPFWLNNMETQALHQLNYLHHSVAQNQQHNIILYARHKLQYSSAAR